MRVYTLGSGSRGNAVLLETDGSRVLIDAGFPVAALAARLGAIGVPAESIEAVLLTHEHQDHARGACAAAARWGCALYATPGTLAAMPTLRERGGRAIAPGTPLELTRMSVDAIAVSHDAAEPVAFVVTAHRSGARAGVAHDLGAVSPALRRALEHLDVLVIESNHDEGMLRAGPYPPLVRQRIAGRHGHLSNRVAAETARECSHSTLAHVVLAHLSDSCNDAALAAAAARSALTRTRFRGTLHVAPQDRVAGPFAAGSRRRSLGEQLWLGL